MGRLHRVCVSFFVCLCLSGCFDYEQTLALKPDGSGEISAGLVINQLFAEAIKDRRLLATTADVEPTIESGTIDGQYVQRETLAFESLEHISIQDSKIEIQNLGRRFYFVGPNTGRVILRQTLEGAEEATSDTTDSGVDADGGALLAPLFKDRTYRLEITVPGTITEAKQLELDENVAIQSQVKQSTVSWTIPMPLMLQHSDAELVFDVSFSGTFHYANATSADHKPSDGDGEKEQSGPAT